MNKIFKPSPRAILKLQDKELKALKKHLSNGGTKSGITSYCNMDYRTLNSILESGKAEYQVLTKLKDYIVNIIPQYATL